MNTLYIIGNGFDIYHQLNTRYQSFAVYLAERNPEVYDLLLKYYPLADLTDPEHTDADYALWWRFEAALADLDYKEVLEDYSDYAAEPGAGEWKDSMWHAYQIEMEMVLRKLTKDLIVAFTDFIRNVDYTVVQENPALKFEEDSHFLNFNYTETLQQLYGLPDNRITYIHERAAQDETPIVLGHGTDPSNYVEPERRKPEGLSPEELERWREHISDQYSYSYQSAKEEILSYYTEAFKNCEKIISQKEDFFSGLSNVEKVVVLGHSLSVVDIKYFQKIKAVTNDEVIWEVSCYEESDRERHTRTLLDLGVAKDRIKLISIADLHAGV